MPASQPEHIRPSNVIGYAIIPARLAIGETVEPSENPAVEVRCGNAGVEFPAICLTLNERREIAKSGATEARWK